MSQRSRFDQEQGTPLTDDREWSENEEVSQSKALSSSPFSTLSSRLISLANFLFTTSGGKKLCATFIASIVVISHNFGAIAYSISAKEAGAQPYQANEHKILPKRVITIFGLESSGTTFLYQTLTKALNASVVIPDLTARAGDEVEIQHISQPWGLYGTGTGPYSTIDLVPPLGCASFFGRVGESIVSEKCKKKTGLDPDHKYPLRFFVNITSHVNWYRSRGVDCTAIIMSRDYSTHLEGKKKHILWPIFWNRVAAAEDEYGKELLVEAMNDLDGSISPGGLKELVMASYETLMFLQKDYLFKLYEQLGVDSDYVPAFHDGNAKYFRGGR